MLTALVGVVLLTGLGATAQSAMAQSNQNQSGQNTQYQNYPGQAQWNQNQSGQNTQYQNQNYPGQTQWNQNQSGRNTQNQNHPELRAALQKLESAKLDLQQGGRDIGRTEAINDVNKAIAAIQRSLR
jgi:hypothetical protein